MIRAWGLAGLAGALLSASPVFAQGSADRQNAENSDILVTGELPTHSEVIRQAREITATTAIRHAPLPRFQGDRLAP